jgi:hypothetical protein
MVMVIADTILETRRRARRLYASDELLGDENVEGIVDRLQRDRADLTANHHGYPIGRDVWLA